jgi:mono/diheme cytochrome c family protein
MHYRGGPVLGHLVGLVGVVLLVGAGVPCAAAGTDATEAFAKGIRPLLLKNCYECHAEGARKGGVAFDEYESDAALVGDRELWGKVLKNVRAGLMPPANKPQPSADEKRALGDWVKYGAFGLDRAHPDPGRVTLRRLNRVEYRNTIRDLMGVDFNTTEEFPPDDTGHGFDNLGEVLTVSPMLLEKYLSAAQAVVSEAVPNLARVMPERVIPGGQFVRQGGGKTKGGPLVLSYYEAASAEHAFNLEQAGDYRLIVDLTIKGTYAEKGFDYNRCEVVFKADDAELFRKEYGWSGKEDLKFEFDRKWAAGEHRLSIALRPTTADPKRYGELEMRLVSTKVVGPADPKAWVRPKNYAKWFGEGERDPVTPDERRERARAILKAFAGKAFRRPVDATTVDRLVSMAEDVYGAGGGKPFEAGVSHAMVAVLASPRFLFREEQVEPLSPGEVHPRVDEYGLATRLSYFLWSTMPDAELLRLAGAGELRKNLAGQVKRMLADPRSDALVQNFTGQWLQARDVEGTVIESRRVADRETLRKAGVVTDRDGREARVAMRGEVERYFAYVLREDRSVLELLDSDYTFLNERLATYYGVPGVKGEELRKVTLPAGSPRGGVLTSGAVLVVTSNPTRTSPVKRGLFILENVLGTPTPPPPPDIPALEDAGKKLKDHVPTLRETLEVHRANPVCASCHARMDPLGLAMENFNALGLWREKEVGRAVDASGRLISGEAFKDVRELKGVLAREHRADFYRCLTEKLLTYALGRGLEYYDVETVDRIVERMGREDGRFSALLAGVIESAPFQQRRGAAAINETGRGASASAGDRLKENAQP